MEKQLPISLKKSAKRLAKEFAWKSEDCLQVIDWLEKNNFIITGIELLQDEGGFPKWIASSNYNPINLKETANDARQFTKRFKNENGALFSLTWRAQ